MKISKTRIIFAAPALLGALSCALTTEAQSLGTPIFDSVTIPGSLTVNSVGAVLGNHSTLVDVRSVDSQCGNGTAHSCTSAIQMICNQGRVAWLPASAGPYHINPTVVCTASHGGISSDGLAQIVDDNPDPAADTVLFDGSRVNGGLIYDTMVEGIRFTNARTRNKTAYSVHLHGVANSTLSRLYIGQTNFNNDNIGGGLWLDHGGGVSLTNFYINAYGDAITVNGGSSGGDADLFLTQGFVRGGVGIHMAGGFGGLTTSNLDVFNGSPNLLIDNAKSLAMNRDAILGSGTAFDTATGDNIRINSHMAEIEFTGTSIKTSRNGHGINVVDCGCQFLINGSAIGIAGGDGIHLFDKNTQLLISGSQISGNAGYGINFVSGNAYTGGQSISADTMIFDNALGNVNHIDILTSSSGTNGKSPLLKSTSGLAVIAGTNTDAITFQNPHGIQAAILDGGGGANRAVLKGAIAGGSPVFGTDGSDASVNGFFSAKGIAFWAFGNSTHGVSAYIDDCGGICANQVTMKGSAASGSPQVSVRGSDPDINLILSAKGNGRVISLAPMAGNGATPVAFPFNIALTTSTTPPSSSAPCTTGTLAADSSYIYYCVASNTWKRAALSSW
ncbi:hypothetical protein [Nitrospirillum amazonense]|nr:hypothetical protein [Nitrospirillum amazonense]